MGRQPCANSILFIMADDLGCADVSCYGQRDYTTPNIDRLAIEELRFTQGYSNSPDCSATRVALMTGRYQARLSVGLEEPISVRTRRILACRRATRRCRHCCGRQAMEPRWSANGISALCRISVP